MDYPLNPLHNFKRWLWMVIIFGLIVAMCSRCSSVWHLKKAIQKNPELTLTDTITKTKIRRFEPFKFQINTNRLKDSLIVLREVRGIDTVKIFVRSERDRTSLEVDCPDCIDSLVFVPRVEIVKERLSNKELFQESKKRLTEWQIAKLAMGQLISVFLLGGLFFLAVFLFFKFR